MLFRLVFPFIFAIFISYLINPGVEHFEKVGLTRTKGILFVYVLLLCALTSGFIILTPHLASNIDELTKTLPEIATMYKEKVKESFELIIQSGLPSDLQKTLYLELSESIKALEIFIVDYLKQMVVKSVYLIPSLIGLFISFIISFYLLKDINVIKRFIFSLSPTKYKKDISLVGGEINFVLKGFIQGQLIIAVIVGTLQIIALYIIGVNFPLFLGIIAGVLNIIPYFGPIIGAIPAVFIALSQSPTTALWTVLSFAVIQQLENAVISPRIIEGKLGLHPLTTIFIVLLGGELLGILGMILAVPIFAIIKIIFKRTVERIV